MGAKYSTYEEVFNDIQLIWDNCKLYNMMGSEIYKVCEKMEKTAKRQIQKFRAAHGLPAPQDKTQSNLRKRSNQKAAASASQPKGSQEESKKEDLAESQEQKHSDEVTIDMKMDLVSKVKKLSNEGLTKLVTFVQTTAPSALIEMEDQRVQIRVDDFDKNAFNQVQEYIEDILINE